MPSSEPQNQNNLTSTDHAPEPPPRYDVFQNKGRQLPQIRPLMVKILIFAAVSLGVLIHSYIIYDTSMTPTIKPSVAISLPATTEQDSRDVDNPVVAEFIRALASGDEVAVWNLTTTESRLDLEKNLPRKAEKIRDFIVANYSGNGSTINCRTSDDDSTRLHCIVAFLVATILILFTRS